MLNYCLQSTLRFKDLHRGQDSQRKTPAAGRHEGGNLPRDARDQLSDVNRVTGKDMNIDRVSGIDRIDRIECMYEPKHCVQVRLRLPSGVSVGDI